MKIAWSGSHRRIVVSLSRLRGRFFGPITLKSVRRNGFGPICFPLKCLCFLGRLTGMLWQWIPLFKGKWLCLFLGAIVAIILRQRRWTIYCCMTNWIWTCGPSLLLFWQCKLHHDVVSKMSLCFFERLTEMLWQWIPIFKGKWFRLFHNAIIAIILEHDELGMNVRFFFASLLTMQTPSRCLSKMSLFLWKINWNAVAIPIFKATVNKPPPPPRHSLASPTHPQASTQATNSSPEPTNQSNKQTK